LDIIVIDNGVFDMYVNMIYPESERRLFTDREDVLKILSDAVRDIKTGGFRGFTLFGIRRSGKTLVLKEFLLKMLKDPSLNVIYIDFEGFPRDPPRMLDRLLGMIIFWLNTRGYSDCTGYLDPYLLLRMPEEYIPMEHKAIVQEYLSARQLDIRLRVILKLILQSEKPTILILDEFQDFLTTMLGEKIDPLGILREILRDRALLILSGSIRTIMKGISRDFRERYFLQMRDLELPPFGLNDTWSLVEKILGISIPGRVAALFLKKSGGFPFYITTLADRVRELMRTFNISVVDALDIAYIQEVFSTRGLIYEHCRYLWSEYLAYAKRKRYLRTILESVSMGPKSISEVSREINVDYNKIYKYVDELVELGLLVKEDNILYVFNRTFATWILARKEIPEIGRISPTEKNIIRRLKEFEKRVALAEKIASHSFELMAQVFVASKLGQKVNAKELGITRMGLIEIPNRAKFNVIKKKDGTIYEADILLENDENMIVEITISKIDARYIEETVHVWATDKYWFISYRGFTESATRLIDKYPNIILTTTSHLEHKLKREVLEREP